MEEYKKALTASAPRIWYLNGLSDSLPENSYGQDYDQYFKLYSDERCAELVLYSDDPYPLTAMCLYEIVDGSEISSDSNMAGKAYLVVFESEFGQESVVDDDRFNIIESVESTGITTSIKDMNKLLRENTTGPEDWVDTYSLAGGLDDVMMNIYVFEIKRADSRSMDVYSFAMGRDVTFTSVDRVKD